MSLWDEGNELEIIAGQISCLGNVLEMVAAAIPSDPESGTLWLCHDVCKNLEEKLLLRSQNLLEMYKKAKK
jgi:hypothetical protein